MSYLSRILQQPLRLMTNPDDGIETGTTMAPAEEPDMPPQQVGVTMADALKYTPHTAINQRYRLADQFANTPPATHWTGVVAAGLGGLGSSLMRGSAEQALRDNQEITRSSLRRAGGGDSGMMARVLIESGNPELVRAGTRMMTTKPGGGGARYGAASGNAEREFIARENLVQRAARADDNYMDDPEGTLEKWRAHYGQARSSYGSSNASAAPPAAPRRPQVGGVNPPGGGADVISQARKAIANGKDPQAVKQRLIEMGVDPSGL